jgi:hypothetical protein
MMLSRKPENGISRLRLSQLVKPLFFWFASVVHVLDIAIRLSIRLVETPAIFASATQFVEWILHSRTVSISHHATFDMDSESNRAAVYLSHNSQKDPLNFEEIRAIMNFARAVLALAWWHVRDRFRERFKSAIDARRGSR